MNTISYTDILTGNLNAIKEFGRENNVNCQLKHGTPLTLAAFEGRVRIVKCLLDAGADTNYPASNGWTPLIAATNDGKIRIVEILLNASADPNLADLNGQTALHHLAFCPRQTAPEIALILISKGADLYQKNAKGETASQVALQKQAEGSKLFWLDDLILALSPQIL